MLFPTCNMRKISAKRYRRAKLPIKPILKIFRAEKKTLPFNGPYHPLNMNNDDISHFSTIPASFAITSNVYFLTHQYLIINNSQSQRALSVSVHTVLWIYFASRRNCGLLPIGNNMYVLKPNRFTCCFTYRYI